MVNAALIGLGWWGKIIASLVQDNPLLRIAAVVEPDASQARAFCDAKGLKLHSDYAEALRDPGIHAVILTTPHRLHAGQIIEAARAGKHVFCEKPLTLTLDSAAQAIQACVRHNVRLGVGHERRHEPPIQALRALFEAGTLGTLLQIEGNFSQNKFLSLRPDNWRLSAAEAACGPMTATGIHLLDLAASLGKGVKWAFAKNSALATRFESGDSLSTLLGLGNGATASINAMLATPFYSRLTVFGSKGWVEIRDKSHVEAPTGWLLTKAVGDEAPSVTDYPPARPVLSNLEAFALSIAKSQDDYPVPLQDMLNTVAAFEAVFKASLSGKVEEVAQMTVEEAVNR